MPTVLPALCVAPKGRRRCILVSGRTFPVEMRYRPFEESRDYDLNEAIADARGRAVATRRSRAIFWCSCPASAKFAKPQTTCAST